MNPTKLDTRFGWHSIVHTMCKEFNLKPNEVWEYNYIGVLNYLSYLHNKNEVEKNRMNNKNG